MANFMKWIPFKWIVILAFALLAAGAWHYQERWLPLVRQQAARWPLFARLTGKTSDDAEPGHGPADEHAGHDHGDHDESVSLELSEQARKNIGLKTGKVQLSTFFRSVSIPGMVMQRPGWTRTQVVAPLTGIVQKIYAIEGEALQPGQPLCDLRLTHEDLVQAQVDFLKTWNELDVVNKEIDRLQPLVEKGSLPQKTLLDRQYEQQKLQANVKAQRESLLLHGLSESQVDEISRLRTLCSNMTVTVPHLAPTTERSTGSAAPPEHDRLYVIDDLRVETGRLVNVGEQLLTLQDYSELYIEGNAFEQDGQLIADVLREGWKLTATIDNHVQGGTPVPDLSILFLSDQVDAASRTLHFYLRLPNVKTRDTVVDGHRYINWRFKPGQRTHLRVPVEQWTKRIVLPASAVVQEGAEWYAFQENGDNFERRPVQVEYRDRDSVVIAQDGSLFPGEVVALTGAAQMQMAIKNKSGGAIDPHAGHTH
jgi:membrane fusion protein, heavy metal efflux system